MINYAISASGYPVYHYYKEDSSCIEARILIRAGSAHEDDDSWGVAHFLEHLCFQGTPTKNKHQIGLEMESMGSFNAYTNYFQTCYHFDTINELFPKCFKVLKEAVFESCFPEHEFEKEKNVIVEECSMYNNDQPNVYYNFSLSNYFGSKDCHPIIGTQESIEGMNSEKLHRFRDKWYGKENILIVVVGGIPFKDVMETINKELPVAKSVEKTNYCLTEYFPSKDVKILETDKFDQSIFGFSIPWINAENALLQGNVPGFTIQAMHTYLYEYIRNDLGLCYGISQSRMSHYDKSYLLTYMLTNKANIAKAEQELFNSYEKIKRDGFPEEMFNVSKFKLVYSLLKNTEDVSSICSYIVLLLSLSKDPNWILNSGYLFMDKAWLKAQSDKLTQKDLQDCVIDNFKDYTKFVMVPS